MIVKMVDATSIKKYIEEILKINLYIESEYGTAFSFIKTLEKKDFVLSASEEKYLLDLFSDIQENAANVLEIAHKIKKSILTLDTDYFSLAVICKETKSLWTVPSIGAYFKISGARVRYILSTLKIDPVEDGRPKRYPANTVDLIILEKDKLCRAARYAIQDGGRIV